MSIPTDHVVSTVNFAQRRRRYVLGLIFSHTIAAVFAILPFTVGFTDYAWPRGQAIFIEALACGQLSVAAIMLAADWPELPIRICALAGLLAFWLPALNFTLNNECWFNVFVIQTTVGVVFLFTARSAGMRLGFRQEHDQLADSSTPKGFSLRQLMLVTAAVSFVLGLWVVIQSHAGQQTIEQGAYPRAEVIGFCFAGVAIAAVIAATVERRKATHLFGLVLIAVVASLLVAQADRLYRRSWWSSLTLETYHTAYMWLTYVYAVIVYLSLLMLRVTGLRWRKV
jgi:hypothetical protein